MAQLSTERFIPPGDDGAGIERVVENVKPAAEPSNRREVYRSMSNRS
jgi:hypothetical protein